MSVVLRFAPSPTGWLHAGNARIAINNYLFAVKNKGRFLLRIDDTDKLRIEKRFEDEIEEDLRWLGLRWEAKFLQSQRLPLYSEAADKLRAIDRLYPCYETEEELALARKVRLQSNRPPIYCPPSEPQLTRYKQQGRKPHFRFALKGKRIPYSDLCRGDVCIDVSSLSDPVLVRENERPLYTLTSVVDDGELKITHVVRGEDHVANSAVQIQIFEALGYPVPRFAHLPLMLQKNDGHVKKISKRAQSLSLRDLKNKNFEPSALLAYLACLGSAHTARGDETLESLAKNFDLQEYGRAAPLFDLRQLREVNRRALASMPYQQVWERLPIKDARFWTIVRGNISSLEEASDWADIFKNPLSPQRMAEDQAWLDTAARALEKHSSQAWTEQRYLAWIAEIAGERKGKRLFLPIRRAISARDDGPDLKSLVEGIGLPRACQRLRGEAA